MSGPFECFSAAMADWRVGGDSHTIEDVLTTATELDPAMADAWLARAALQPEGRRVSLLRQAVKNVPNIGQALASLNPAMRLGELGLTYQMSPYVRAPIATADDVRAALIVDHVEHRRYDDAEALILALPPQLPAPLAAAAAQLYVETGLWNEVLATFARSPQLTSRGAVDPLVVESSARQAAEAAARLGMFERAVEEADRTTPGSELWRDAMYWAALSLRHLGRAEEATTKLDGVLAVFSQFTAGWDARNNPTVGIETTSVDAMAARTDRWDRETEPTRAALDNASVQEERAKAMVEADEMLADMIGMDDVKDQVSNIEDTVLVREYRQRQGEELSEDDSLHIILEGPPGVGKTQVARILALKFFGMGVVPANKFVESSRTDLEGRYMGDATVATREFLQEATPGVAFLDEFHNLHQRGYSGGEDPYGNAMIAVINKYIDDNRDQMILIGAGYTDRVEEVFKVDAGLSGRFAIRVRFDSYDPDALADIAEVLASKSKKRDQVTAESKELLRRICKVVYDFRYDYTDTDGTPRNQRGIDHLSNARFIRRVIANSGKRRDREVAVQLRGGVEPPLDQVRQLHPRHVLPATIEAIRQIADTEVGNQMLTLLARDFGVTAPADLDSLEV
ncbi:AAA family ATPase [Tsukamurella ocularis]|uniref:AAA family ATPase n=1 Tax=Tsukamurella ocularis TaxID=1970234 RepID=UPI00216814C2|nr:AAA family ATPase [Tsukamurella ocularis]MCS3853329.1 type VII secretion ATPase EccA [Tsukamurella ocularis]